MFLQVTDYCTTTASASSEVSYKIRPAPVSWRLEENETLILTVDCGESGEEAPLRIHFQMNFSDLHLNEAPHISNDCTVVQGTTVSVASTWRCPGSRRSTARPWWRTSSTPCGPPTARSTSDTKWGNTQRSKTDLSTFLCRL